MERLRSICFIFSKDNTFEVCYLKEFFKWAGFSYAEYLYGSNKDIFKNPDNCNFDIIVNINGAMPNAAMAGLKNKLVSKFYEENIVSKDQTSVKNSLSHLLKEIANDVDNKEVLNIFKAMWDIYIKFHLVRILYNYTTILHQKMPLSFVEEDCKQLEDTLNQLEDVIDGLKGMAGLEYALYAKYFCRGLINECLFHQERMERYDIGKLLEDIDEIYTYDKEYYKAEYLKAWVANQSCMYNARSKFFYENCIERCTVNVCKSYFYYSLGKWDIDNKRLGDALKAFRDSYRLDSNNIKAIFKLAVERKRVGENGMAKKFLQDIINIWTDSDDMGNIPIRDIEYAYKTRLLFSLLVDSPFQMEWEQSAKIFLDFVDPDQKIDDIPETFFVKRLYGKSERIKAVLNAMRCRVELAHEKNCFEGEENDA